MKNIFKKNLLPLLMLFVLSFSVFLTTTPNIAQAQCADLEVGSAQWLAQGCDYGGDNGSGNGGGGAGGGSGSGSGGGGVGCSLATNPKIQDVISYTSCILNLSVVPLIFSLALVMFVYGVMQYVLNEADEGKREKGKQFMVWGIIALTVMVSVWGLVNLLGGTFGINTRIIPSVTPN
ncbi:MAG: hypothetical protein WC011_01400 [Candidatus Paceibacterota bacterium]